MTFSEFWQTMDPAAGFALAILAMGAMMAGLIIFLLISSKLRWGTWLP